MNQSVYGECFTSRLMYLHEPVAHKNMLESEISFHITLMSVFRGLFYAR